MNPFRHPRFQLCLLFIAICVSFASKAQTSPKPATEATKSANRAIQETLRFDDKADFDDAARGFVAKPDTLIIKDANGRVIWDLEGVMYFQEAAV